MKYLLAAMLFWAMPAYADYDMKTALDVGTYILESKVTGSSFTGTAFINFAPKRMDGLLFNNTASTIWIGTVTATALNGESQHANILNGMPVLSSSTYRLDGIMSDALYFTCNSGVATCEVRVHEGTNR